jgi:hypothetical protein
MPKIVHETKLYTTFQFSCWGRNYVIRLSNLFDLWPHYESRLENGEDGLYKATDLTHYLKIEEGYWKCYKDCSSSVCLCS